jgi:hypothetical protein
MRARSTLDFHSQFRPTPSITAGVAGMESKENDGMSTAIISLSSPSQHLAFCLFVKKMPDRPFRETADPACCGGGLQWIRLRAPGAAFSLCVWACGLRFGHSASALDFQRNAGKTAGSSSYAPLESLQSNADEREKRERRMQTTNRARRCVLVSTGRQSCGL